MECFNQFTIIIPEHNRPHHLKRLLEYYLAYGVKIIVADSSIQEFCYLKEYAQKITYRYFPCTNLAEKIFNILPLIKTPYVLMCADDDFILPNAVKSITDFLDQHLDYNSGQGIYGDFDPLDSSLQLALRYSHMLAIQIDDDKGEKRLLHLMGNYFQYYYCVYRTSLFTTVYTSVVDRSRTRISNLCLLECFVSSYPAIIGKHIIIPMLYAVRENAYCSAATITDNIPKIVHNSKYAKEYEAYIELLAECLMQADQIKYNEAIEIIRESILLYMKNCFPNYFSLNAKLKRWMKYNLKENYFLNLYDILQRRSNRKRRKLNEIPNFIEGQEEWENIKRYILYYYDICYK